MLPAAARVRRRAEFASVLREGARAGTPTVVVHAATAAAAAAVEPAGAATDPPRVGFIVSRSVGPAVVRNRVRRRLRHLLAARLPVLPTGTRLVVRAQPAAASSTFGALGDDLDRALRRCGLGRR